jgi:S-adenosylmethionine decarboxylase
LWQNPFGFKTMSNGFFEGTEKKVELVVSGRSPDLRGLGERRWREIVEAAQATVLSRLRTEHCDAYLLSESSLFVFERKMLMITCGRTRLVDAVAELLEDVSPEDVQFFIFERKNEVFPHRQPTSFYEDACALNALLPGTALRFGDEDEHHLYLYHLDRAFDGEPEDVTMEILMYGLDRRVAEMFDLHTGASTAARARSEAMHRILPGYTVEEHLFEPSGYSLNGVRGKHYGTIHVTPQDHGSYASFETNHPFGDSPASLCNEVLGVFRPRAFDVVLFDQGAGSFDAPRGYHLRSQVTQRIDCGYRVRFLSHFRPPSGEERPRRIPIAMKTSERGSR